MFDSLVTNGNRSGDLRQMGLYHSYLLLQPVVQHPPVNRLPNVPLLPDTASCFLVPVLMKY